MKKDSLEFIIDNFENDRILPLKLNNTDMLQKLAQRYGNPNSQIVVNDIEQFWFEKYCEEKYNP